LKGELRIEPVLDDDRHFAAGRAVIIASPANEINTAVEYFRRQHGRFIVKLRGIDSITEAEKLAGADIQIPAGQLLPLAEGWFYTFELKGCRVFSDDECIGTVTDVMDFGGTEILKVDDGDDEVLVPFAQAFLRKIDLGGRRIDVNLPEGLRGLNK
jgi:16S rRNA processing protein RimM